MGKVVEVVKGRRKRKGVVEIEMVWRTRLVFNTRSMPPFRSSKKTTIFFVWTIQSQPGIISTVNYNLNYCSLHFVKYKVWATACIPRSSDRWR